MERFRFQCDQFEDNGSAIFGTRVAAEIVDAVSVGQVVEAFFKFLEDTGVHAETIEDATSNVLMDRFVANEFPLFEDDQPAEGSVVEDENGYGLGI